MALPINRDRGWLTSFAEQVLEVWVHYCAIWSWVGPFHYINKKKSKYYLVQNNIRHDFCWAIMFVLPIFVIAIILPTSGGQLVLLFFSVSLWRLFDLFLAALRGAVFGYKNPPEKPEWMTTHRAQRRLLLTFIYIMEVIFNYAIVFWILQIYFGAAFDSMLRNPWDAVQLSFSTISTVGYGTYAPNDTLTTILALIEFVTGLLFIAGSIAQMASLLKTSQNSKVKLDIKPKVNTEHEGKEVKLKEVCFRRFMPPIITLLVIASIFVFSSSNYNRARHRCEKTHPHFDKMIR